MMFKRTFLILATLLALGLSLTVQAPPAGAQDQAYYTYVSEWAVPRSQWAAFEKERDAGNPALQRLVADGTIIAWANAAIVVHGEDGYTHVDWFTTTSRASVLKAIEVLRGGSLGPAFSSVTKHRDIFLHTLAHGGKTTAEATAYLRVTGWQAKSGEGEALQAHVMKYIKPALDADVASGALLMYNFDVEDVHTDAPGQYYLAILFANGEAIDNFYTRLAGIEKENPAVGEVIGSLTVSKDHRDLLARVSSYQHK